MSISGNLRNINDRIRQALERSGRTHDVTVLAATKYADAQRIMEAIESGVGLIGENRVQDAAAKFPGLPPVKKHMIGHLQTNKARQAVEIFDCIQSVDSLKLAKEISRRSKTKMQVMIEVNISGEAQKFGIAPDDAEHFHDSISRLENIDVVGMMAVAPHVPEEKTRPYFRQMKKINDRLKLENLSMGMSEDFEVAIEEGSTMVRLGSAIFKDVVDNQ